MKKTECPACGQNTSKPRCASCGQTLRAALITRGRGGDPAAFRRLIEANFDARPADVEGSYASRDARKVKAAEEAAKLKVKEANR